MAQLTGSVTAPSTVLSGPPAANVLEQALKSLLELEDQDDIHVTITRVGTGRRRRQLLVDGGGGYAGGASAMTPSRPGRPAEGRQEHTAAAAAQVGSKGAGRGDGRVGEMMHGDASLGVGGVNVDGAWVAAGFAGEGGEPRSSRQLQVDDTTSTAEFEVFFLNDPTETVAAGRGVDASVKLLEGQEVCIDLGVFALVVSTWTASLGFLRRE